MGTRRGTGRSHRLRSQRPGGGYLPSRVTQATRVAQHDWPASKRPAGLSSSRASRGDITRSEKVSAWNRPNSNSLNQQAVTQAAATLAICARPSTRRWSGRRPSSSRSLRRARRLGPRADRRRAGPRQDAARARARAGAVAGARARAVHARHDAVGHHRSRGARSRARASCASSAGRCSRTCCSPTRSIARRRRRRARCSR